MNFPGKGCSPCADDTTVVKVSKCFAIVTIAIIVRYHFYYRMFEFASLLYCCQYSYVYPYCYFYFCYYYHYHLSWGVYPTILPGASVRPKNLLSCSRTNKVYGTLLFVTD